MGPRFKIYGSLVLWIVGLTIFTALLWNALGWWMNSMEPGSQNNMRLGFVNPLAWLAYALPGLMFAPLIWNAATHKERIKLEPLNLPKPMEIVSRFRFPLILIAGTSAGYFILGREWGGALGGFIITLFITGMHWAASTVNKDDRKAYTMRQSRVALAKRIDVAIDNYIKMMPSVSKRARDKEFPFLSRIHHVNHLALGDEHAWNTAYMNYSAGNLRSVRLFLTELKLKLFREDIIWALLHAAEDVLEPSERKYDADKAEKAVATLEALLEAKE